jgi:replicative DNA helicase
MASLLREGKGAFKDARSNGLRAELLTGDGLKIFNFVSDYYLRFGDLPPLPIIAGKTGINLEDPPAGVPSAFLVSEVLDRALHSKLLKGWNKLDELLRATPTDAKGSLAYLEEFLLELRREKLSEAKVQSLFTLGPEVVAYYQMMEQGKMGIQTPWAGVNEPTMGFWPMDLILFVARVGIGKCVDESTVITDPVTGVPRTIREVVETGAQSLVYSWSPEEGIHAAPITAKVDTGRKECLEVEFLSGRKVVVTPEHPFLSQEGWRRADKICARDVLGLPAYLPEPLKPKEVSSEDLGLYALRGLVDPLPNEVFCLPNHQLSLLIARIWMWHGSTDGSVKLSAGILAARQLQHLLLRFGIQSRVTEDPEDPWALSIPLLAYQTFLDAIPITGDLRVGVEKGAIPSDLSWPVELWSSSGVFWDSVVSITPVGERKIYDLSVSSTSCFIANDIIVHNTWTAVITALHAWQQGKRVLFASTEISRLRIATRMYALLHRLPYRQFIKGKLDVFTRDKFFKGVEDMLTQENLYVVGGDFDFRVETLSAALEEIKPDLTILDGAYLLRTSGQNRTEKAANAFDDLKRLAHRHKTAMVVTHQFNREVKANVASSVRTESIGLTDVAGWNADLIFGLVQTDEMKKDRKMRIKPLKVREGIGEEIEVNWNLDTMDFSQLGVVGGSSSGDADEFDTGVTPDSTEDKLPF